jgi:L-ascorbate metabolism protein UlaG (beta-lactamase superfamily)
LVVTTASGARRLGGSARGLEPWSTTRLESEGKPAIEVTATPCRHGPPFSRPVAGDVVGFALRWEGQEHGVLWISGDTVLYDGVRQVAERLEVDTALIHLGAVRFPVTGPLRYSMTAADAIELCRLVRPRTAIPIHYEGWAHFKEGREAIERELAGAPEEIRPSFRWLPIGSPVELGV